MTDFDLFAEAEAFDDHIARGLADLQRQMGRKLTGREADAVERRVLQRLETSGDEADLRPDVHAVYQEVFGDEGAYDRDTSSGRAAYMVDLASMEQED